MDHPGGNSGSRGPRRDPRRFRDLQIAFTPATTLSTTGIAARLHPLRPPGGVERFHAVIARWRRRRRVERSRQFARLLPAPPTSAIRRETAPFGRGFVRVAFGRHARLHIGLLLPRQVRPRQRRRQRVEIF